MKLCHLLLMLIFCTVPALCANDPFVFGDDGLQPLDWHLDWVYSVVFSPGGRTLASDGYDSRPPYDGIIKLWDVQTSSKLKDLSGQSDLVKSIVLFTDGHTLTSSSDDGTIKLWSVA